MTSPRVHVQIPRINPLPIPKAEAWSALETMKAWGHSRRAHSDGFGNFVDGAFGISMTFLALQMGSGLLQSLEVPSNNLIAVFGKRN
jgi:hypothetical protein